MKAFIMILVRVKMGVVVIIKDIYGHGHGSKVPVSDWVSSLLSSTLQCNVSGIWVRAVTITDISWLGEQPHIRQVSVASSWHGY